MHIPQNLLDGRICPVPAAVSGLCLAGAAFAAYRSAEKPDALRFAAVSAFIFAAQMMNFPISGGTSGHLLGGVLASALLGVPFGVLALALVVALQAVVFADGGLNVLGANILNMAVIGTGLGGLLRLMPVPPTPDDQCALHIHLLDRGLRHPGSRPARRDRPDAWRRPLRRIEDRGRSAVQQLPRAGSLHERAAPQDLRRAGAPRRVRAALRVGQ